LLVNFDASASSDPDAGDSVASYKFNFGDGSAPVTQATPTISHTYNSAGNYNATLNVVDTHGGVSENIAAVVISVSPAGALTNYALAVNGGLASASSTYASRSYPPEAANNGDRTGGGWEAGTGGWNDNTRGIWGDSLEMTFNLPKTISEIRVFTLQNDFRHPVEPDASTPADVYGILDFNVQYWDGATWQTVTGGSVTGNNKAMRVFAFADITTTKVRVLVNDGRVYFSRIVELEAFGTPGQP
jgi:PKD repeat protein